MAVPFDPAPQFREFAHPERLVSASWLSARLGTPGLKVVESDQDSLLYDIGHIPGAVRLDWRRELNNALYRDIVDPETFARIMSEKGIARDDTVVVYGDHSNWWAAFTLWILELYGHEDVRLLDGGRDAWMAEERDTSFAVPDYPATDYPVIPRQDASLRAFVDDVRQAIGTQPLLDVRSAEEYEGAEARRAEDSAFTAQQHGHIPSALSFPWGGSVDATGRFRRREVLEELYEGLHPSDPTIVYCHLGDRSAHTWFVLKYLLGFDNVRNYDGSWAEWGNMVRMPIAQGKEPGVIPEGLS
ncbi:sulfurtransferase [Corynebacterium uropygiale]|uniref:Sulfurtransferase n=1 Tax=Corynebacterium uropygiale TaxID=1775911 RepID=A0A9X1QR42_9CORY|nr:sulfurtransferase [Corynebacterium uropygiale]MCF4006029.1 sulfurtransferase [Corynebacterium uropygiale]